MTNTDFVAEQPSPNQPIDSDRRNSDADQRQISDVVERPEKRKRGAIISKSPEAIPGTTVLTLKSRKRLTGD
jgi:hypothetical protein